MISKRTVLANAICAGLISFLLIAFNACTAQNSKLTDEEFEWLKKTTLESFVFVEGGSYMEGDMVFTDSTGVEREIYGGGARERHKQEVESYSIQKYEVSFKEFDLFYKDKYDGVWDAQGFRSTKEVQPQLPVNFVTWNQANEYCIWLGEQLNLSISLPSESQWEFAARSRGLYVAHATDDGTIKANVNRSGSKSPLYGHPSGHFPPNPLGIYDMTGSRLEWTKEGAVRGFMGSGASVLARAFHAKDNFGEKGIRCVLNSSSPVNLHDPILP